MSSLPTRIKVVFGVLYALPFFAAIFPPFYLAGSGQDALVFGIPFSVVYWIIDAVFLAAVMVALYVVESRFGVLDSEDAAFASPTKGV